MLLHVIWGFGEDILRECPTFSVTGVMLQWADGSPAHVRQGRFRWQDDGWQAPLEVTRAGSSSTHVPGLLRLSQEVSETWTRNAVNGRNEAARQLREVMHARGWRSDLGVITLT